MTNTSSKAPSTQPKKWRPHLNGGRRIELLSSPTDLISANRFTPRVTLSQLRSEFQTLGRVDKTKLSRKAMIADRRRQFVSQLECRRANQWPQVFSDNRGSPIPTTNPSDRGWSDGESKYGVAPKSCNSSGIEPGLTVKSQIVSHAAALASGFINIIRII